MLDTTKSPLLSLLDICKSDLAFRDLNPDN